VAGDWRRLHNEELHNSYTSQNSIRVIKSRRMRGAGHIVRMGETRNAYKILFAKSEGKSPLGRPRRGWQDIVRIDLRELWWEAVDWINLVQDGDQWRSVVNTVTNLRVLQKGTDFLTS
jgi:hypothetical protein